MVTKDTRGSGAPTERADLSPAETRADFRPASPITVLGSQKYIVEGVLGQGGMGVVYQVRDVPCGRTVALKILSPEEAARPENAEAFMAEARITARLEHPHIVPIHELGTEQGGRLFYSMKRVKGRSLIEIIDGLRAAHGEVVAAYPLSRLLDILLKVFDAVGFAHAHGVVHRDLKPDNIMVGEFGEVLLLDWGIAREETHAAGAGPADGPAPPYQPEPPSLQIVGTPAYMAPELILRNHVVDRRCDIYSLGATLYALLTLRAPFRGRDLKDVLRRIISGDVVPPAQLTQRDGRTLSPDGGDERAAFPTPPLPHLPEGRVPAALSDIVMRAMAALPADRYQTVAELQADIQAVQAGTAWHLAADVDFAEPGAVDLWQPAGGHCEIADGALRIYGGEPHVLLFRQPVASDVRIEFECRQEGGYFNDVSCFVGGILAPDLRAIPSSGYEFKIGAYGNSRHVLSRCGRILWSGPAARLERGRTYSVRCERVGSALSMALDNVELVRIHDPDPLAGADRAAIGLHGWMAETRFACVRIYTPGTPAHADVMDLAERFLQRGRYETARDLFDLALQTSADTDRRRQARTGLAVSRRRETMEQEMGRLRRKLEQTWHGRPFRLTLQNEGVALDISGCGVRDLEPLSGENLAALHCADNEISSLEPLRGMPLAMLGCSGNPVSSLAPLAGAPLTTLHCEACRITTLAPLRGMGLTALNCAANALADGLQPLQGMPLEWLSCVGCGLDDLAPLAGAPLAVLYADANRLRDLIPLAGARLAEFTCTGNLITSLDPLRGGRLSTLHCGLNRIADLSPLSDLPLATLGCHANLIVDLAPLENTLAEWIVCAGNPLRDIGLYIRQPPRVFFFDCSTLSCDELTWIHGIWSKLGFEEHARQAEALLALGTRDIDTLRRLSSEFRGHRYLLVPRLTTWEGGQALCRELGGHLAVIRDREENGFVSSLLAPGTPWTWIGLQTGPAGHRWTTGEPVGFQAYASPLDARTEGPKVFCAGKWRRDTTPGSLNPLLLEWDA